MLFKKRSRKHKKLWPHSMLALPVLQNVVLPDTQNRKGMGCWNLVYTHKWKIKRGRQN
jgi:hypothetical protein